MWCSSRNAARLGDGTTRRRLLRLGLHAAAGLAPGLALAGCGGVVPGTAPAVTVLDWRIARDGDALTFQGRARNDSGRNLRRLTAEATFYGPGGGHLGTIVARTPGDSFAPGRVAAFSGVGLHAPGMGRPIVLFRDNQGRSLPAAVPAVPAVPAARGSA
jgi:hypothetical protein